MSVKRWSTRFSARSSTSTPAGAERVAQPGHLAGDVFPGTEIGQRYVRRQGVAQRRGCLQGAVHPGQRSRPSELTGARPSTTLVLTMLKVQVPRIAMGAKLPKPALISLARGLRLRHERFGLRAVRAVRKVVQRHVEGLLRSGAASIPGAAA